MRIERTCLRIRDLREQHVITVLAFRLFAILASGMKFVVSGRTGIHGYGIDPVVSQTLR